MSRKRYESDVILTGIAEAHDERADALFAAGCDDGTLASRDGTAWVHFNRESASLEEAIASALSQVRSAGFAVARIELDVNAAAALMA